MLLFNENDKWRCFITDAWEPYYASPVKFTNVLIKYHRWWWCKARFNIFAYPQQIDDRNNKRKANINPYTSLQLPSIIPRLLTSVMVYMFGIGIQWRIPSVVWNCNFIYCLKISLFTLALSMARGDLVLNITSKLQFHLVTLIAVTIWTTPEFRAFTNATLPGTGMIRIAFFKAAIRFVVRLTVVWVLRLWWRLAHYGRKYVIDYQWLPGIAV